MIAVSKTVTALVMAASLLIGGLAMGKGKPPKDPPPPPDTGLCMIPADSDDIFPSFITTEGVDNKRGRQIASVFNLFNNDGSCGFAIHEGEPIGSLGASFHTDVDCVEGAQCRATIVWSTRRTSGKKNNQTVTAVVNLISFDVDNGVVGTELPLVASEIFSRTVSDPFSINAPVISPDGSEVAVRFSESDGNGGPQIFSLFVVDISSCDPVGGCPAPSAPSAVVTDATFGGGHRVSWGAGADGDRLYFSEAVTERDDTSVPRTHSIKFIERQTDGSWPLDDPVNRRVVIDEWDMVAEINDTSLALDPTDVRLDVYAVYHDPDGGSDYLAMDVIVNTVPRDQDLWLVEIGDCGLTDTSCVDAGGAVIRHSDIRGALLDSGDLQEGEFFWGMSWKDAGMLDGGTSPNLLTTFSAGGFLEIDLGEFLTGAVAPRAVVVIDVPGNSPETSY